MNREALRKALILTLAGLFGCVLMAKAQYFGQNKPRYHQLDFEVLETPSFDIHHYLNNNEVLHRFADDLEHWYAVHKAVLGDSFAIDKPILLYNDHGDFQMTNAVFGRVGPGTGGVTEGLKNRIVMPLAFTNEQTHHVLGHELVHVFQFDMIASDSSLSLRSLSNVPLWMIEGLAEYMSLGRIDAHTAMWMRDAVINKDIPTIRQLSSNRYFPYRYGQAFWAFLTGEYGDAVIRPFFLHTARVGVDQAIEDIFSMTREEMSAKFISSLNDHYGPLTEGSERRNTIGRRIISPENSGRMNVSPAMSPDGRYIVFLSEKNLFSTDIYLATSSGKIINRLTTIPRDGNLDDLSFMESAGAWSRDSKRFAFVAFKGGQNVIVIKDVQSGKTQEIISIEHIPAISNLAWSPDGRTLVFSGMANGQVDLFSYDLKSARTKRLTDDIYSEIHPNFNKEGTHLAFATDRASMESGRTNGKLKMNIAVLNLETGKSGVLQFFPGADNVNPNFDHAGNIVFLSDRDGYRNMYRYDSQTGEVFQLTRLLTGISGIAKYSPAISVSTKKDRLVYTHYFGGEYVLHQSSQEKLLNEPVDKYDVTFAAATLPPLEVKVPSVVQKNLVTFDTRPEAKKRPTPYRPRFTLDHIGGGAGMGVGGGTFGGQPGFAGGVDLFFSDIAGNHQLFGTLAMNGRITDIGGQVTYLNREGRIAFGGRISHLPQRFLVGQGYGVDSIQGLPVNRVDNYVLTIFEESASLVAELPFSKTTRLEANAGLTYRSFRMHLNPTFYDRNFRFVGEGNRERVPLEGDEYNLGNFVVRRGLFYNVSTALVGDNTRFGVTAPMNGYRYRVEATKFFGTYNFWNANADFRAYQYVGPFSLAVRLQHGARYGRDADNFNPVFLGWQGFVRGYTFGQIERLAANRLPPGDDINLSSDVTVDYRRLSGSKFFLSGFEIRMPLTGPERLAKIPSKFLFTDLNFFFDIGTAFDQWSHFRDGERVLVTRPGGIREEFHTPLIAMSTGVSLRANVFNALILEPYMAYPLRKDSRLVFGVNVIPGW